MAESLIQFICAEAQDPCKWPSYVAAPSPPQALTKVFPIDSQPIGCIIDPKLQRPWNGQGSVMVAARSCMIADALTKVAALAGPSCQPLLDRFGAQAMWDSEK